MAALASRDRAGCARPSRSPRAGIDHCHHNLDNAELPLTGMGHDRANLVVTLEHGKELELRLVRVQSIAQPVSMTFCRSLEIS